MPSNNSHSTRRASISAARRVSVEIEESIRDRVRTQPGAGHRVHFTLASDVLETDALLRRLGATLVPLALVSVGYQIQWSAVRGKLRELGMGLGFKLVAGPAVVALLFAGVFGARGETIQITIFEAAMAPQIGAAIVAVEHDLDPALVTLMVGIGIPLSFLTVPLWWYLLKY